MAPLKVYDVREMRDANMPRTLCTLLGARSRGQSPYWVAAHNKDEALARLREVGSLHRAHPIALIPAGETEARIVARWQRDPESETNGLIPVLTTPENETANCGSTACPACRSDQWDEDGEKVCVSCVARAAEWDDED